MLMMGGMSGFSGFTPAVYASLSDMQIIDLVFALRDDDEKIITEAKARQDIRDRLQREPLPTIEQLEIPQEALMFGNPQLGSMVPLFNVRLFWHVWKRRGTSNDEIMTKWAEDCKQYGQVPMKLGRG